MLFGLLTARGKSLWNGTFPNAVGSLFSHDSWFIEIISWVHVRVFQYLSRVDIALNFKKKHIPVDRIIFRCIMWIHE